MNVVILHYHFQRGGVTQVVQNHIRWLKLSGSVNRILLISGNRVEGLSEETRQAVEGIVVEELEYDSVRSSTPISASQACAKADLLTRRIVDELTDRGLRPDDSVLHWHNHSLGKNTAAPAAAYSLADRGWRSLLQIHDFAEDGRPKNYCRVVEASGARTKRDVDRYLYPSSSNLHYVTLTQFDSERLGQVGIRSENRSVLPNSVTLPTDVWPDPQTAIEKVRQAFELPRDAKWCIYPVRGIRRKNVGEFLLLSRWTPADTFAGLTLCPTTPIERQSYQRWRRCAKELSPRCVFDAAHHPDVNFAENLAASRYIISTSVAEGFGMAFLEPWLAGREVIARHLPSVFEDFEQTGIRFPARYQSIPISGKPDWLRQCREEIEFARRQAWSSLPEAFQPAFDDHEQNLSTTIDFAQLIPKRQIEVLQRVAADQGFEDELQQASTGICNALHSEPNELTIERNAKIIRNHYSLAAAGNELLRLYLHAFGTERETESTAATPQKSPANESPANESPANESPANESPVNESPVNESPVNEPAIDLINCSRPFYACRTEDPIEE